MSSFGEDNANPFARPSPWPSLGAQPMRVGVPPRAAPAAEQEAEPPAAPTPRFIVVDQPVFRAAPAAPQVAMETLTPVRAPATIEPEPELEPRPVAEAPATPEPAPAEAPLAQPILRERIRPPRPQAPARRWRLGPLLGAAVAGAAALGALFFLIGRETAATDARTPARGLTPGQIVAPVATVAPAAPATSTPTAPEPTSAVSRSTQFATATPTAHAVRTPARPIRLDVPAMASAATSAPPPPRELAATAAPSPVVVSPQAVTGAPAPSAQPAKAYTPPAPPPADAPFVHHLPDGS